jgi:hypothetical protein
MVGVCNDIFGPCHRVYRCRKSHWVATNPIPVGTIVYAYDSMGIVVRPNDPRLQNSLYSKLFVHFRYTDKCENFVMPWDYGCYMNHCCNPNTLSISNAYTIVIRDIAAGEALTEDYGVWRLGNPITLVCKHSNCRNVVGTADNPLIAARCCSSNKQSSSGAMSLTQCSR